MDNTQSKIPFVLYSLSGYDKCIGIVNEYNDTFCNVTLFLNNNSPVEKEFDCNGNILSFGIIGKDD